MALPMMTATEIAGELAETTGVSRTDVRHVLDEFKNLALDELANNHRVKLLGLVQLEPKVKPARSARMGRNPATGEPVKIKAKGAQAVVKARVLSEAKNVKLSLKKLTDEIEAGKPKKSRVKKTTKKAAKKRK